MAEVYREPTPEQILRLIEAAENPVDLGKIHNVASRMARGIRAIRNILRAAEKPIPSTGLSHRKVFDRLLWHFSVRPEKPISKSGLRRFLVEFGLAFGTKKRTPWKRGFATTGENFYESQEWRELRYQVLKQYGGKCMLCGRSARDGVKIHVDHIKPRATHPELSLERSNLQVLCEDCNLGKLHLDDTDWRSAPSSDLTLDRTGGGTEPERAWWGYDTGTASPLQKAETETAESVGRKVKSRLDRVGLTCAKGSETV